MAALVYSPDFYSKPTAGTYAQGCRGDFWNACRLPSFINKLTYKTVLQALDIRQFRSKIDLDKYFYIF